MSEMNFGAGNTSIVRSGDEVRIGDVVGVVTITAAEPNWTYVEEKAMRRIARAHERFHAVVFVELPSLPVYRRLAERGALQAYDLDGKTKTEPSRGFAFSLPKA